HANAGEEVTDADSIVETHYVVARPKVEEVDPSAFLSLDPSEITGVMDEVIEVEAPIEQGLLYRRILKAFGLSKLGTNIEAKLDEAFKKVNASKTKQGAKVYVWRKDQDPKAYRMYRYPENDDERRNIDQIPPEEIIAAVSSVLAEESPRPADELIKASIVKLGFRRMTAQITESVKKALTLGIRRNIIKRDGDTYSLDE
ncbi:MAG: DUF3320 domain-containing protein, partial [Eggerthellaceae bacterium]|nr:DUF3320 domain-containing protein [Eggerthellaceae bacterium]